MKIRVTNVTELPAGDLVCFDLHEEFGLAYLVEKDGAATLFLNENQCWFWPKADYPNPWLVKWRARDKAFAWPDKNFEIGCYSTGSKETLHISRPDKLFFSANYIFVSYDMDTNEIYYADSPYYTGEPVAAFSLKGHFIEGVSKHVPKAIDPSIEELSAGYTWNDNLIFISHGESMIYRFDPANSVFTYFPFPFRVVNFHILAGDDKHAYAIHDHRPIKRHYPDTPDFEFATFDLAAQTASRADFSVVEHALVVAGFEMAEIKFQQNSIGKTIVSDSRTVGFQEVSDYL